MDMGEVQWLKSRPRGFVNHYNHYLHLLIPAAAVFRCCALYFLYQLCSMLT